MKRKFSSYNSEIKSGVFEFEVNGDWSTWSDWGPCDCDSLKQNRTRQCDAMFGGWCEGSPNGVEGEIQIDYRDCLNDTCPGISHRLTSFIMYTLIHKESYTFFEMYVNQALWYDVLYKMPQNCNEFHLDALFFYY